MPCCALTLPWHAGGRAGCAVRGAAGAVRAAGGGRGRGGRRRRAARRARGRVRRARAGRVRAGRHARRAAHIRAAAAAARRRCAPRRGVLAKGACTSGLLPLVVEAPGAVATACMVLNPGRGRGRKLRTAGSVMQAVWARWQCAHPVGLGPPRPTKLRGANRSGCGGANGSSAAPAACWAQMRRTRRTGWRSTPTSGTRTPPGGPGRHTRNP